MHGTRKPPMTAAERQAKRRERTKQGKILLKIKVDRKRLAEALPRTRRLTRTEARNQTKLAAAVERVIEDFITRWVGPPVTRDLE
jgi:hypothetical protein